MLYEKVVFPLVDRFTKEDPELAHELALWLLRTVERVPPLVRLLEQHAHPKSAIPICALGANFPHQVGLAAGFVKNGEPILTILRALGFGFVEIGTVLPSRQTGSPRPRLARLPGNGALINWLGFPSQGVSVVARNLAGYAALPLPLGINIGPLAEHANNVEAVEQDCSAVIEQLLPWATYFVLNLSSPNTPGLRALQHEEHLAYLVPRLIATIHRGSRENAIPAVPLLIKLSPDLETPDQLVHLVAEALEHGAAGIIATNTTVRFSVRGQHGERFDKGGLSGKPLRSLMLDTVRIVRTHFPRSVIIASGGISTAEDVRAACDHGADLCQVYTAWVYRGPFLLRHLAG